MTLVRLSRIFRPAAIAMVLGASILLGLLCLHAISRAETPVSASAQSFVGNDFVAFYSAALLASAGRLEGVYDSEALHSVEAQVTKNPESPLLTMGYPPFFQLVVMPLSRLDYLTAYRVWVSLTLTLLMIVAWYISPHWQTLVLVPLFPAVAFCAAAGQNGNLSAAILGCRMDHADVDDCNGAGSPAVGLAAIHVRSWALAATIPLLTPYFFDYDLAVFVIAFVFLTREIRISGFNGTRAFTTAALWLAQPILFLLPVLAPHSSPNTVQFAPALWALVLAGAVWRVREAGLLVPVPVQPDERVDGHR